MRGIALGVLILALTAAACSRPQQVPPGRQTEVKAPQAGGSFRVPVKLDPYDWDLSYGGKSQPMGDGMAMPYDMLLAYQFGPGTKYEDLVLAPSLAERWEVSPDAKTFTFTLRKGVKFANLPPVNGRELTASDVKWSYEYASRTGQFAKLPGGQMQYYFEGMTGIETPDRYTAVVKFKDPFAPFVPYTTSAFNPIVPKEIHDQDGHLKDRAVGTGPFQLDADASQKGSRWIFRKNPGYWQTGKPYLDEVRWLVLKEEATEYAAFQAKQVDLLFGLRHTDAQQVTKANAQAQVLEYVYPKGSRLRLSQGPNGPLRDIRVRQAVALAINRDEINQLIGGGRGKWALPGAYNGLFTDAETKQMLRYDPEEARRLLAQAGYADSVTLDWPYARDSNAFDISSWELIQAQLKRVGIKASLYPMDKAAQRARRYKAEYELDTASGTGGLEGGDLDAQLFGQFHSKSSANWYAINDPELDRLVVAQRLESNLEKRRDIWRQAVKRVVDQVWVVELIYSPQYDIVQSNVQDYLPHAAMTTQFTHTWIEK